jgi:hypothetical protein
MTEFGWLACLGLGMFWQGILIVWVGGMPLMLRSADSQKPEKGTPGAFAYFWMEQYRFIGLILSLMGVALVFWGWFS